MSLFSPIPSQIEECSTEELEWDRLKELVAGFASSGCGRDWLSQLRPSCDLGWIVEEQRLVREMRLLLAGSTPPPVKGLFDPDAVLARARITGASLEQEELRDLLPLLDSIAAWRAFHPSERLAADCAGVTALFSLPACAGVAALAGSLRSRLNPDGTLSDDASPGLRRVRKEIERQQRSIEEGLRRIVRRLSEGGETQEEIVTIRGDRFVIPVKAEFKRRIPGVVHGASSSGQTVFLEPLETIEQNNELARLMDEEQAEIRRVLVAMTEEVSRETEGIVMGARALARLDTLQARARFADQFDCVCPQFPVSSSPVFEIHEARHPLLEKRLRGWPPAAQKTGRSSPRSIVPISFALGGQARQLIVSGPNTGGKTLVLKTAGLLTMMAQSGIPVPARDAALPVFHSFFADIGDAQSIENDLSTFSSRIVHLNHIAQRADAESLVLLDELGSSTDPEEGAALAVAFAHHFLDRRAWCLISTHYMALKVYAAQTSGVLNAAVTVDPRTLEPTYELRLGVPGISAGIHVAERLGLDPIIAEQAHRQLDGQAKDISFFLEQLHARLAAVEEQGKALQLREEELAREKIRLNAEGLKEWRAKVRDLEEQMQSLLKDFAYRTREAVAAVEDRATQQKLAKDADRRIARLRREFGEQFDAAVVAQHSGADKGDPDARPHMIGEVSVGDMVKLKSLGKSGRVLRQMEQDIFEVAVGPMKMRVARADIAAVERTAPATPANPVALARQRGISVTLTRSEAASSEINVIGRTAEEAAEEVDQFLDQAYLAGISRVRIVHGVGAGILRRTLRAQLERHPHVEQIAEASQAEGGAGATVVDLRS